MIHPRSRFSQGGLVAALTTFLSFMALPSGWGQSISGTVVGTVSDATGAVVGGAKVSAKNIATGVVLSTVSGSDGNYTVPNVPPGTYDISAQLTGFNTAVASKNVVDENNLLGIPNGNIPGLAYTSGIFQFNITGFTSTGDPGWTDAKRIANIFDYTDSFTWIRGKHTLKFGGDVQRIQSTLTNSQDDPRGIFNFNGNYTSNQGAPGTGNPFASFLLGDPNYVARDFVNTVPPLRMLFVGAFVQDDFRISKTLTLNVGLRWDLFTRPVEKYNRQSTFDPTTGLIDVASSSNRGPNVDNNFHNFQRRQQLCRYNLFECVHAKDCFPMIQSGLLAAPPAYTFGNSAVGHIRGPGINNTDFSIAKETTLGAESRRLRVEADFFNLFNMAHFSNPNTTLGNAGFGAISSDRLPPRLIQLGAKVSF
jgi:hypothetical protein